MADWLDGYFENKPIVDATVNPAGGGVIVADGTVTNAKLAAAAANTIKSNPTGGSLAPTDMTVGINTIVGRGPTGNLDDLAVKAGLTITDTTIGRPAFTGDVTASADSNALTIANNAVTTAKILDANVTTAKVALNAIGNARMAKMATNTVKGNATGSTADSVDMTISGGLYTDGVSVLKSKSGIGWHYTYTTGLSGDPTAGCLGFNDVNLAAINTMRIHQTTLGGRDLDTYIGSWSTRGRITIKSNNAAGTAFMLFNVSGTSGDSSTYWSITVTPVSGVGSMPTNGEEVVVHYEAIGNAADVVSAALDANVARFDAQFQLIDKNNVVRSGTAEVANYAALQALNVAAYENFAVVVDNMAGKPVFLSDSTNFLPLNGSYTVAKQNTSVKKVVCANAVTWSISNFGGNVRLSGTAHGITAASDGYSLYATNTVTNWASGTFHEITYVDANTLQTTTPYTSSTGTPTFAAVATKIPVLTLTVPPLRANSRYLFDCDLLANTGPTTNRIQCLLGAVELTLVAFNASSNASLPIRAGFKNLNNVSKQSGIYGKSSSGSGGGSANVVMDGVGGNPAGVDTSGGAAVFTVSLECQTVDEGMEMGGYIVRVEG